MSPTHVTDTGHRSLNSNDAEASESSSVAVPSLVEAHLFYALFYFYTSPAYSFMRRHCVSHHILP